MDASGLKKLFRAEMRDEAAPYLWSDLEVLRYADEAQKMFCRLTDGISDATSTVCALAVKAGDTWLSLDRRILKIRSITRRSDGCPIDVINYEDMAARGLRFTSQPASVRTLIVGMEENKARCIAPAQVDDTLDLMVFRLPLDDVDQSDVELEIPEQHHYSLLHWMKHLAYLKQDAECFDRAKAGDFEALFRASCDQAVTEQGNKRHKIRTVSYGGL